jgi:hypothetical protein
LAHLKSLVPDFLPLSANDCFFAMTCKVVLLG